jgi:hypothetical protein
VFGNNSKIHDAKKTKSQFIGNDKNHNDFMININLISEIRSKNIRLVKILKDALMEKIKQESMSQPENCLIDVLHFIH